MDMESKGLWEHSADVMSGSRGRLDPDSGSGTTQSTSRYSTTIKPVPTLDYERLPRLFKNVVLR